MVPYKYKFVLDLCQHHRCGSHHSLLRFAGTLHLRGFTFGNGPDPVTGRWRTWPTAVLAAAMLLGTAWWKDSHGPSVTDLSAEIFLPVACALVLGTALLAGTRTSGRSRGLLVIIAVVLLLVILGAWPLFDAPFDLDAPVLRAAFAAVDVFGDWNHPFLPYLLNRPATWISFEPRVLRVIPFLFLCAETTLAVVTATRDGGSLAGALCGVWFACEIPRRHGLSDLGDWDIAGTFLMVLVAWTQRRDPPRTGSWITLAALLVAGVCSSWLMIVPAGVMVTVLAIEAWQGRMPKVPVGAVSLVFVALAIAAGRVFLLGHQSVEPGHAPEVTHSMLVESPMGRNTFMAVPVALGLTWAIAGLGRLPRRFVLGALVLVPAAVAVSFRWSHVNGGYYAGLVTPLLCYAAAVATARSLDAWTDRLSGAHVTGSSWHASAEIRALLVLSLGLLTINLEPATTRTGWEYLQTFTRRLDGDQLPILTNSGSLARAIGFERARAGVGPITAAIDPPRELARRIRLVNRASCTPVGDGSGMEAGFYLVHLAPGDPNGRQICLHRYGASCHELQPPEGLRDRAYWFYRCDGVGADGTRSPAVPSRSDDGR